MTNTDQAINYLKYIPGNGPSYAQQSGLSMATVYGYIDVLEKEGFEPKGSTLALIDGLVPPGTIVADARRWPYWTLLIIGENEREKEGKKGEVTAYALASANHKSPCRLAKVCSRHLAKKTLLQLIDCGKFHVLHVPHVPTESTAPVEKVPNRTKATKLPNIMQSLADDILENQSLAGLQCERIIGLLTRLTEQNDLLLKRKVRVGAPRQRRAAETAEAAETGATGEGYNGDGNNARTSVST